MILRETYRQKMKERIDSMTHREERESAIWSALPIKRITACMLITAMVFPFTACKKNTEKDPILGHPKYTSGQEILETDTFFHSEVNPLKIPTASGKEVKSLKVGSCEFEEGIAIASYEITYSLPGEKQLQDLTEEEREEYFVRATSIFDGKGDFVAEISGEEYDLCDVAVAPDGNASLLCSYFDKEKDTIGLKIRILDRNGKMVRELQLPESELLVKEDTRCELGILSDGRYTVSGADKMFVYDEEGKKCFDIFDRDRTIGGTVIFQNGKYYVTSAVYDADNGDSVKLKEVDMNTGALGRSHSADDLERYGTVVETEAGLFLNTSSSTSKVDIESGEITEIFNWNDTDVDRTALWDTRLVPKNEDELYAVGEKYKADGRAEFYLVHLTRAEKNPHAGKRIIVIGGTDVETNESFLSFLYKYNQDPENPCRAVLMDYSDELKPNEGASELQRKVYLDILSGEGPDILLDFSDFSAFSTEEVMADLNPYLDGSDGIRREDYFDNLFRMQEKDGKLYHIPIRFSLMGFEVNTDYISETVGWTFDAFEDAAGSLPKDVSFVEGMKYREILDLMMRNTLSDFVDYKQRTVDFQNDEMKRILQLVRKHGVSILPEEDIDTENEDEYGYYSTEDRVAEKFYSGLLAVRASGISTIENYALSEDAMKGKVAYLGYPSTDGCGMQALISSSIGIVSTSKYKDLAWDLVRDYLNYMEQERDIASASFSVNRNTFGKEAEEEMNVNNRRYEEALRRWDAISLKGVFTSITPDDINAVRTLIENVGTVGSYDASIIAIILEEAEGYFAGDRTEDEVLKNIQNRTATVIKEL